MESLNNNNDTNIQQTVSATTNVTNLISEEGNRRVVQNFRLIWLDNNINENNNENSIDTIAKLREVINTVQKFTNVNECIDYMTDIEDEKIFLICSEELGQTTVPLIHDISQINYIYIFS